MKRKSLIANDENNAKRSKSVRDEDDAESMNGNESNTEMMNQQDDESTDKGRAGRVLRIYLKNFMCHSSLEIDLNSNVNYIIGRNGSGKSAILSALIVGLGGKANTTNRGSSMTSFIKRGQNSAVVEITLSNNGPMAYKRNKYGEKITVVRIFGLTGGSRYKLKNEVEKVVSTAFKDVRRLIEALNIQVDNPVCILNQDVARTFLNTNDTRKKYQMFMKATNLESIQEKYKTGLQRYQETKITLKDKKDSLDLLESESKKLQKTIKIIDSVQEIENKKKCLQSEIMWSKAYDAEQEMQEKEEEIKRIEVEIKTLVSQTKTEQKKGFQTLIIDVEQQLKEIQEEETNNQQSINTVKTDLDKLNEEIFTKRKIIDSVNEKIRKKTDDRRVIENELEKAASSQPDKQKILLERTRKNAELEEKLHSVSDQIATTENEITQSRNALQRKIIDAKNIKEEINHLDGKTAQRKTQIKSLKSQEDNAMAVYGKNIHKVLEHINASKEQFSQLPRGPIGSYIKLKDKKWALAVEEFIGFSMLQSFCVNNAKDSEMLNKIFKKVLGNEAKSPSIICSKFFHQVHDTSKYKTSVPPDCVAMVDVLQITDPVVTNCLIDQVAIETIVLTPSSDLSMKLMSEARNVPRNCTRSITVKGDQFYPDPAYRSYACRQKAAKFLQVNATELIKQYEADLRNLSDNLRQVTNQAHAIKNDIRQLEITFKSLEEKLISLNNAKLKLQNMMQDLKLEELPTQRNLDILRDELAEIDKYIENKNNEITSAKEKVDSLKLTMSDVQVKINNLKKISKDLNKRSVPLMNQLDEANVKLKAIDTDAKYKTERVKKYQTTLAHETVLFNQSKLDHEKLRTWAEEIGIPPKVRRSVQDVMSELEDLNKTINEMNNIVGDKEHIRSTYKKVDTKVREVKEKVKKVNSSLARMSVSLELRRKEYKRLKMLLTEHVKEIFTHVLNIRKFNGTLEIDHANRTLELIVVPQHGSQNKKHILSGGERSYATVSFLITLWQVMEFPFYFLDEFDVFMDKVNRRAVMDMLLRHGLDHNNLQFAFLTPQDISNVKSGQHVTIHRMADPLRNAP